MSDAVDVVIRVSKTDPSDVFALFPADPADNYGDFCTCYQHVGQHSSADYHGCIATSRPATEAESSDLLRELVGRGYLPRVIRKATYRHHVTRRETARQ